MLLLWAFPPGAVALSTQVTRKEAVTVDFLTDPRDKGLQGSEKRITEEEGVATKADMGSEDTRGEQSKI
jgi:hypothetical protein